jgi:hypothetical protein
MGLTQTSLFNAIAGTPRPWTKATTIRVKTSTQKAIYERLLAINASYGLKRLAEKIHRWRLPGNDRIVAERIMPRLHGLRRMVPPRVQAAAFSTLWNRWTTPHRYQERPDGRSGCLLGCRSALDLDTIEHYLRCPVVLEAARLKMGLHLTVDNAWDHLLLAGQPPSPDRADIWWAQCALLVYAVYRTTNAARHAQPLSPEQAIRALQQALYEGARNHLTATCILDSRGQRTTLSRRAPPGPAEASRRVRPRLR